MELFLVQQKNKDKTEIRQNSADNDVNDAFNEKQKF